MPRLSVVEYLPESEEDVIVYTTRMEEVASVAGIRQRRREQGSQKSSASSAMK
jgi:hypothetical protein